MNKIIVETNFPVRILPTYMYNIYSVNDVIGPRYWIVQIKRNMDEAKYEVKSFANLWAFGPHTIS